jgi:glutamate synthase domain-containing protein 3
VGETDGGGGSVTVTETSKRTIEIEGHGLETRDINRRIKQALADGYRDITVLNPGAKHNLAVGILQPCRITFEGSCGYFAAGLVDGPVVHVKGRVGWSVAENMMDGEVVVEGTAGSCAGAALRGGTLVVKGSVGARTGINQKGGDIVVGGDAGFITGFMMQKGRIVVCGDAGRATGDSMYDGEIFVGGKIASLGIDAVFAELDEVDRLWLDETFERYGLEQPPQWRKIAAGRKLYNYDKLEPLERKIAL